MIKKYWKRSGTFFFASFLPLATLAFAQDSDLLRQLDDVLKQADRQTAEIRDELEQLSHTPVPEEPRAAEIHRLDITIRELALEEVQRERKLFQEKRRLLLLKQDGKISAQEMMEQELAAARSLKPERGRWRQRMDAAQAKRAALASELLDKTP